MEKSGNNVSKNQRLNANCAIMAQFGRGLGYWVFCEYSNFSRVLPSPLDGQQIGFIIIFCEFIPVETD